MIIARRQVEVRENRIFAADPDKLEATRNGEVVRPLTLRGSPAVLAVNRLQTAIEGADLVDERQSAVVRVYEAVDLVAAGNRELIPLVLGQDLESVDRLDRRLEGVGANAGKTGGRDRSRSGRAEQAQRNRVLLVRVEAVHREAVVVEPEIALEAVFGVVAGAPAAHLREQADADAMIGVLVLDRVVETRLFGDAEAAAERAGVANQRVAVGTAGRIVVVEVVGRERVLTAVGDRAPGLVRDAGIGAGVDRAVGAARIAVRRTVDLRQRVVVLERARAVGEAQRVRIKAEVHVADEIPIGNDLLFPLQAHIGLAEVVRRPLERAALAGVGNKLLNAVRILAVELRSVAFVADAGVDSAIEREAELRQRAIGRRILEPAVERVPAGDLRRRRGHALLGRQIGGLRHGGRRQHGRARQKDGLHFHLVAP